MPFSIKNVYILKNLDNTSLQGLTVKRREVIRETSDLVWFRSDCGKEAGIQKDHHSHGMESVEIFLDLDEMRDHIKNVKSRRLRHARVVVERLGQKDGILVSGLNMGGFRV